MADDRKRHPSANGKWSPVWCGRCRDLIGMFRDERERLEIVADHEALYHDNEAPAPTQKVALA